MGLFDFLFLAEGCCRTGHRCTVLAALAAVTDRLGLIGTIDTTSNEPFEVARQFATLDHLSDGRAGWNVGIDVGIDVATSHADRYTRAEEFVTVARRFWDSWAADAVVADDSRGVYVATRSHPPRRIPRRPSSTCAASPRCRQARRATRSFCTPVTRRTAGTSAPGTPTPNWVHPTCSSDLGRPGRTY